MDALARRELLETDANPGSHLDYITTLNGHITPDNISGRTLVGIRYVPDKLILAPSRLGRYLDILGGIASPSLEAVASAILEDLNNELVARWIQVTICATDTQHLGIDDFGVMLEDRLPFWVNSALLLCF